MTDDALLDKKKLRVLVECADKSKSPEKEVYREIACVYDNKVLALLAQKHALRVLPLLVGHSDLQEVWKTHYITSTVNVIRISLMLLTLLPEREYGSAHFWVAARAADDTYTASRDAHSAGHKAAVNVGLASVRASFNPSYAVYTAMVKAAAYAATAVIDAAIAATDAAIRVSDADAADAAAAYVAVTADVSAAIAEACVRGAKSVVTGAAYKAYLAAVFTANLAKETTDDAKAAKAKADVKAAQAVLDAIHNAESILDPSWFITQSWHDIDRLIDTDEPVSLTAIYGAPLWDNAPLELLELKQHLQNNLTDIGLGFINDDLDCLWQGKLIDQPRLGRYVNDLSDELLNDAQQLQRYIVDGIAPDNPAVRVLLVGPGGAGKTSLYDLITQRQTEKVKQATIGVAHHDHQSIDLTIHKHLPKDKIGEALELYLWDFGGQSIFHNLHQGFFSRENVVYVVVVDSRHEQAPDEWLAQINQYVGGQQVPVLLVTNCYEGIQRKQNHTRLMRQFPNLLTSDNCFYHFPCNTVEPNKQLYPEIDTFDQFITDLVQTCIDSQFKISQLASEAIETTNSVFNDQKYVTQGELRDALNVAGQDKREAWQQLKEKLESLGRLIMIDRDICLNPDWIVNEAYRAISHPALAKQGGFVDADTLYEDVLADVQQPQTLLAFLEKHKAVMKHEEFYFFPDSAKSSEPAIATQRQQQTLEKPISIEYTFACFPLGFKSQFAVNLYQSPDAQLDVPEHIWRDGLLVTFGKVQVLVEYNLNRAVLALRFYGGNKPHDYKLALAVIHKYIDAATHMKQGELVPLLTQGRQHFTMNEFKTMFENLGAYRVVDTGDNYVTYSNSFNGNTDTQNTVGENAVSNAEHSFNKEKGDKDVVLQALDLLRQQSTTDKKAVTAINEVEKTYSSKIASKLAGVADVVQQLKELRSNGLSVDGIASVAKSSLNLLKSNVKGDEVESTEVVASEE